MANTLPQSQKQVNTYNTLVVNYFLP